MGLFTKKELCPVCGGEVKGLFLTKIGDKKTLCKSCSKQISMNKGMLKSATPELIQEHLDYRKKNAEKYAALRWDVQYNDVPGLKFGVDAGAGFFYLVHDDLHDDDNPVVFSFDQLTGYELYRSSRKVDDADTPGDTALESLLSVAGGIGDLIKNDDEVKTDFFKLKLTFADPYWQEMEIKISFFEDDLYDSFGRYGFDKQLTAICQFFKHVIRKEPVSLI